MPAPLAPPTPKPPDRCHHGDLRRALVLAGLEALEAKGVAALTIRGLARRLAVSHAAPAHHFPDKLALLAAVAAEGFRRFGDALEAAAASAHTPQERMQRIGLAYVRFALDHPATFRVMFGRELPECGEAPPELAEASARAYGVLQATVRALATSEEEARARALGAWALVHGAAVLYLDGALRDAIPPGQAGRARFEAMLQAVMTAGPPLRPRARRAPKAKEAATSRPPPRKKLREV